MMGVKVISAALGGVTLFAISEEDATVSGEHGATMNVVWGQNASNGELGLGEGKPRSATKPMRCEPLDGLCLLQVGGAANTTFYLTRNQGPSFSNLPRYPEAVETLASGCLACGRDDQEAETLKGDLLECEKCDNGYHLKCLTPPLDKVPQDEWFCPTCVENAPPPPPEDEQDAEGEDADDAPPPPPAAKGKKRSNPAPEPAKAPAKKQKAKK